MTPKAAGKKASFGTSMGVSSIIAILVILLLVVFSILALTTARADLLLSQKSSDSIKAYYDADAAAEEMMAEISRAIAGGPGWQRVLENEGCTLTSGAGGMFISYTISIDEYRNLNVELFADADGRLKRLLWQVTPAKEWIPDESINLYTP